jgi:uncharacterized membrane protein
MQPVQSTPAYWLEPGHDLEPRNWQRRTRRPVIVISTIAGVILAVLGIGAITIGSQTRDFTAQGSVMLTAGQYQVSADDVCGGTGEFEEIRAGTRVRILDVDLAVLEQSTLATPQLSTDECRLEFSVSGIPDDRDRYVVEIGDMFRYETSRGALERGIDIAP